MKRNEIFLSSSPLLLVGNGEAPPALIQFASRYCKDAIAVDNGAEALSKTMIMPQMILGDLDSHTNRQNWPLSWRGRVELRQISEQDTTDFEKAIYSTQAPLYLGIGFLGKRVDHTLAALHVLLRYADRRIVLLSDNDILFLCPQTWSCKLEPGTRFSIWPVQPVTCHASSGLRWPLQNLYLAAGRQIGTSNQVISSVVSLQFDGPGAALILPLRALDAVMDSLSEA